MSQEAARKNWNKLKERLKKEGSESVTNCHQLKLEAADGQTKSFTRRRGKRGGKL
ncbi:MAG: hypothetical protein VE99_C0002G0008 [candidate division Kazan bacterium GW2011_GWC1_52_13]|nr:MAG: hypothetical protein VE99_C0002G0008 [candidate division Kazan bacterium GW2011_GWC1_52_13]